MLKNCLIAGLKVFFTSLFCTSDIVHLSKPHFGGTFNCKKIKMHDTTSMNIANLHIV